MMALASSSCRGGLRWNNTWENRCRAPCCLAAGLIGILAASADWGCSVSSGARLSQLHAAAATQWVAWKLGFQPQLGQPWFELGHGMPVYLPPAFFWWWFAYDAYAPKIFIEGGCIAASGGIISMIVP